MALPSTPVGHTYSPKRGQAALATQYSNGVSAAVPFKIRYVDTYVHDTRPGNTGEPTALNYNTHRKLKTWYFDKEGTLIDEVVYIYRAYLEKRATEITSFAPFPTLIGSTFDAGDIDLASIQNTGGVYFFGVQTPVVALNDRKIFSFVVPDLATDPDAAVEVSVGNSAATFVSGNAYKFYTHRITNATPIATSSTNPTASFTAGSVVATGNTIVVVYDDEATFKLYLSTNLVTPVATVATTGITNPVIRLTYRSTDSTPTVVSLVVNYPTDNLVVGNSMVDGKLYKIDTASDFVFGGTTLHDKDMVKFAGDGSTVTVL